MGAESRAGIPECDVTGGELLPEHVSIVSEWQGALFHFSDRLKECVPLRHKERNIFWSKTQMIGRRVDPVSLFEEKLRTISKINKLIFIA